MQILKRICGSLSLSGSLPIVQKRYCEKQMLVILIFILFGDFFKFGRLLGLTEYNWIQGHFSDIGLPAQVTSALYYLYGHLFYGRVWALILPPVIFSLYELSQGVAFDPVDVICYFTGSIISFLCLSVNRVLSKSRNDSWGEAQDR